MRKLLFFIVLTSIWLTSCKKDAASIPDNNEKVLSKLAAGINLSNWFNDYSDQAQYATRFNSNHFTQIKNAGFTYVRLPIGASVISDPNNLSVLNTTNLGHIDQAVRNIIAAGLSVTIVLHSNSAPLETKLATDPLSRLAFRQFWKNLATHFKQYDTTQMIFEIFNEPHIGATQGAAGIDKNWWAPFQEQLIQSIREVAPDHYIIAGAENWNNWNDLTQLTPSAARNIVYTFHFYDPFTFTHQGADWSGTPYDQIRQIPYPGTPENMAPLVAAATTPDLKFFLQWYGTQRYNADSVHNALQKIDNWSKAHQVPVICNEFGVYKPYAPAASRLRYLQEFRTAVNQYKIGWAVWDYDEGFGMASYPTAVRTGVPEWDAGVLTALGLQ
ncbi:MAG TPA: cellulase family glycosylhydrolase [Sediminibacterium sp.]|nr:cellulase family glycosylhydrolase [Sediminibacterium sp.]